MSTKAALPTAGQGAPMRVRMLTLVFTTLACLVVVFALSLVATATASATTFNFRAAKYPVKLKSASTNLHGFEIPGVVTVCRKATFNTEEPQAGETKGPPSEKLEAKNPEHSEQTLEVHPTYSECRASAPVNSIATVKTEGCNYLFHAGKPSAQISRVDLKCAVGNEIKIEVEKIAGCTISIGEQKLGFVEYVNNTPAAGEVEVKLEFEGVKTKATSQCGLAGTEFTGPYREGELIGVGESQVAKMAPVGKPAKATSKGVVPPPEPETAIAVEVAPGGPHWYKNHTALPVESGGPGAQGTDIIAWGKLVLEAPPTTLGVLTCFNEFAGDIYNPEGGSETATAGEGRVDAFALYDCTNPKCDTSLKSHIEVIPEGLGVIVEEPKAGEKVAHFGEWETSLYEEAGGVKRFKVGNKAGAIQNPIQFLINCPSTGLGNLEVPARGVLTPKLVNGTVIGSGPGKIEFGAGSGELELPKEGKVKESLKSMGYEGGEIISASNP